MAQIVTHEDTTTILETPDEVVEVMPRRDGTFRLTIHNRRRDSDVWDDLSATLRPQHFAALGSIVATRPACTCGAPIDGAWANIHTAGCASLECTA